jgi:hypothetical protein
VHPISKLKFYEFDEKKTVHSSGSQSQTLNFMTRLMNTFFMSSFVFYNRYSEILYEGDSVKLFGVVTYNTYSDAWEISKPLALLKSGVGEFLNDLWWDRISCYSGIFFRGLFTLGFAWATLAVSKYLLKNIHLGIRAFWRRALARQDEENRVPGEPPRAREGIDKIDIESYSCTECKSEARSVIF